METQAQQVLKDHKVLKVPKEHKVLREDKALSEIQVLKVPHRLEQQEI